MTKSNGKTSGASPLRREALPLRLDSLHKSQLKAAVSVLRTLDAVADEIRDINTVDPSELDGHRSSRIFFLSGEPGNGKTTVYTSLRRAFLNGDHGDTAAQGVDNEQSQLKKTAAGLVTKLSRRIVWLEPLDLEPMTGATNFLAAVMARLNSAIDEQPRNEFDSPPPGILEPQSRYQEALMRLQRLQTDLALSWEGNLPARAAHIDPDVFAAEVLRAERARLSVNRRLQDVLARLSRDIFSNRRADAPLFVLPIDDFYLNPESSMELLRLLRMITSPHLFILLMGDIDVIEELFYQKSLGDLIKVAGEGAYRVDEHQRERLEARAEALRAGALRKLLPPGQRAEVGPLEIEEARQFRPPGAPTDTKKLEVLLGHFTLPGKHPSDSHTAIGSTGRPESMKHLLLARWTGLTPDKAKDYAYSGAKLLEAPSRNILDLWHRLENLLDDTTENTQIPERLQAGLRRIIGEELLQALYEQDRVTGMARKRCEMAIEPGSGKSGKFEEYRINTKAFRVDGNSSQASKQFQFDGGIELRRALDWTLALDDPARSRIIHLDFSPRVLAWFAVLHDFLVLSGDTHEDFATSKAIIKNWVPDEWPRPHWKTFWQFELLQQAWNDAVDNRGGPSFTSSLWCPYRWAEAICGIYSWNSDSNKNKLTKFDTDSPTADDWARLKEYVGILTSIDNGSEVSQLKADLEKFINRFAEQSHDAARGDESQDEADQLPANKSTSKTS